MLKDLKNNLATKQSLEPKARTATANGASLDLQGVRSACVVWDIGLYTNGSFTGKVQESSDDSSFSDVASGDLEGAFTVVDSNTKDNTHQRVGYKGTKRYIRAIQEEGSSPAPGTGMVSSMAILYEPLALPAA